MAEIKPFSGLLYNHGILSHKKPVFAPPYDVISPELQKELYRINPYNVVRLILGKIYPNDNASSNRYIRADGFLKDWIKKGILITDDRPAIYIYRQTFICNGKEKKRTGFIALLKLEEFKCGKIYPHEETKPGPKEDQLKLMQATRANLSPIFTLFSDKDRKVKGILSGAIKSREILDIKDKEGVLHTLWRWTNPEGISRLREEFKNKELYLADGHHRYESALALKKLLKDADSRSSYFTLTYFTPLEDEGVVILPTHRIVNTPGGIDLDRLKSFCMVKSFNNLSELSNALRVHSNRTGVGIYSGGKFYFVKITEEALREYQERLARPECWIMLPTAILHHIIIPEFFGEKYKNIEFAYTQDANEVISNVNKDTRKNAVAFLLRPIRTEEFKAVVGAEEKMPPKTTFFYPKVLSGLVFYKFKERRDGCKGTN